MNRAKEHFFPGESRLWPAGRAAATTQARPLGVVSGGGYLALERDAALLLDDPPLALFLAPELARALLVDREPPLAEALDALALLPALAEPTLPFGLAFPIAFTLPATSRAVRPLTASPSTSAAFATACAVTSTL